MRVVSHIMAAAALCAVLGLATSCADAGDPPTTGAAGTTAMATGTATSGTDSLVLAVGDPAAVLPARIGPPSVDRRLDNTAPDSMGARVWEYAFSRPVASLTAADGSVRRSASVVVVLDGAGRILRLLDNPNAFCPAAQRLQRGSAAPPAVTVSIDADAAGFLRAAP